MIAEQSETPPEEAGTVTRHELAQCEHANATGRPPVVFVHGLWLLPSSWDRWAAVFEEAGYAALTPGWPDDPETVEEANAHPEVFAHKTIGQVADHFDAIIRGLTRSRRSSATPSAGCWPRSSPGGDSRRPPWPSTRRRSGACCPCRSRRSSRPGRCSATPPTATARCRSPSSSSASASPTPSTRTRPSELYETFAVPAAGAPLFQAAAANLNPWTEAKVDTKNPERGPLLIISGEKDNTVPWAIANASFKQQNDNPA